MSSEFIDDFFVPDEVAPTETMVATAAAASVPYEGRTQLYMVKKSHSFPRGPSREPTITYAGEEDVRKAFETHASDKARDYLKTVDATGDREQQDLLASVFQAHAARFAAATDKKAFIGALEKVLINNDYTEEEEEEEKGDDVGPEMMEGDDADMMALSKALCAAHADTAHYLSLDHQVDLDECDRLHAILSKHATGFAAKAGSEHAKIVAAAVASIGATERLASPRAWATIHKAAVLDPKMYALLASQQSPMPLETRLALAELVGPSVTAGTCVSLDAGLWERIKNVFRTKKQREKAERKERDRKRADREQEEDMDARDPFTAATQNVSEYLTRRSTAIAKQQQQEPVGADAENVVLGINLFKEARKAWGRLKRRMGTKKTPDIVLPYNADAGSPTLLRMLASEGTGAVLAACTRDGSTAAAKLTVIDLTDKAKYFIMEKACTIMYLMPRADGPLGKMAGGRIVNVIIGASEWDKLPRAEVVEAEHQLEMELRVDANTLEPLTGAKKENGPLTINIKASNAGFEIRDTHVWATDKGRPLTVLYLKDGALHNIMLVMPPYGTTMPYGADAVHALAHVATRLSRHLQLGAGEKDNDVHALLMGVMQATEEAVRADPGQFTAMHRLARVFELMHSRHLVELAGGMEKLQGAPSSLSPLLRDGKTTASKPGPLFAALKGVAAVAARPDVVLEELADALYLALADQEALKADAGGPSFWRPLGAFMSKLLHAHASCLASFNDAGVRVKNLWHPEHMYIDTGMWK